jgi:hypothetical protein
MAYVVSLFGVLAALIGVVGIVFPGSLIDVSGGWKGRSRFLTEVALRAVVGVVFLMAAPDTRLPEFVYGIGVIASVSAVAILGLGQTRLDRFIGWWHPRVPPAVMRISALFGAAFGLLLVYAGS